MQSIIAFIFVLSVLVIIHEFGHFITAKYFGVRVERFSIGFGKPLVARRVRDTEYRISAIPLGGYVKMAGDEPDEARSGDEREFRSKPPYVRSLIVIAGPLLNYVLAFFLFVAIFAAGSPAVTSKVGSLIDNYPAKSAGILPSDTIIMAEGKTVKYWDELTEIIHKKTGGALSLRVKRDGEILDFVITPKIKEAPDIFGKKIKIGLIGITPAGDVVFVRYNLFAAVKLSYERLMKLTLYTYKGLWLILTGTLSFRESMTGPVGIFVITGEVARLGLVYLLQLLAVLSASLAIFNLIPFPVLDGGHLLFLAIEKLKGKPLKPKLHELINRAGMAALVALMAFVFYNDFVKFGVFEKIAGLWR